MPSRRGPEPVPPAAEISAIASQLAPASENERGQPLPQLAKPHARPRKASTPSLKVSNGRVRSFVRDRVFPADGERTEIKAMMQDYRGWCTQQGLAPIELKQFLDEIEKICRKLGIEIEVGNDRRVYCLNVRLGSADAEMEKRLPAAVH